jgi:NitT/TauT family transport system substrate-binding protein
MTLEALTMIKRLFLLLASMFTLAYAQDLTPVTFTLDWAIQGPQAFFLLAEDQGYFEEEGIDITIDRGFGSSGTVSQIAGGAYDIGFADINSMIEFNASNPEQALTAVAVVYNFPPFAIFTLAESGIDTPEALVGNTLGAPVFDAAYRLFPLFAEAEGIDPDSVEWIAMDGALREPSLIRGEVEGISGFYFTAILNLEAAGVSRDEVNSFLYSDSGVDVYGNAIMAPTSYIEENPEVIRGLLAALTRAWQDTLADPEAAIAAVQAADPLTDPEVELARLQLAIDTNMLTPEVMELGFGAVDEERLARSIAQVVEIFDLPTTPSVEEVFNGSFLPPLEDRLPPSE